MAVRCWRLESWLFHSSLVSGGKDKIRRIVSLGYVSGVRARWGWERTNVPNLEDPLSVSTSPDAEDVLAIPDAEHHPAHLLTGLAELIANNGKQQVLPISVGNAFSQTHHPLPSVLILLVLPYWPNAFLEQVVVRDQRQR
jgi:hypothetical protein